MSITFKYEYENPSFYLEEGIYILDVTDPGDEKPKRLVAELYNNSWYQTGFDYDPRWGALKSSKIEVIARIDLETLNITEIN